MEMVNQMSKFSPSITYLSKPLRELLSFKTLWTWTFAQNNAILKLKEEISLPRVFTLYGTEVTSKVSADASAHGFRAVLLQLSLSGLVSMTRVDAKVISTNDIDYSCHKTAVQLV